MTPNQNLPAGWRLEALAPSHERRECAVRITTPEGRQMTFTHKPFQFACDITRQLQAALLAQASPIEVAAPFRIARPEQLRVARDPRPRTPAAVRAAASGAAEDIAPPERDGMERRVGAPAPTGVEL